MTPITQAMMLSVCQLAKDAGRAILDIYEGAFDVSYKADHSPLTQADRAAHDLIQTGLAHLTPQIPLLSEESDEEVRRQAHQWPRFWLVDPLDGTREFVARNGEFTVNIALIEDGQPVWGVVYAPVPGILWAGGRGLGTIREQAQRCESVRICPHREGERWKVVGSRSHLSRETLDYLAPLGDALDLIPMGSSLKLCLVAEGKAHLYPRLGPTCEWDTAAAQAVVEGAGDA